MIRIATLVLAFFAHGQLAAAPAAEAFGALPLIHDAAISPAGDRVAIIVNFDGTYGVRLFDLDNLADSSRAVLLSEGVKPGWIRWVNDGRVLVSLWQSEVSRGVPITMSFLYTLDADTLKGNVLIEPRGLLRQDNTDVIDFLDWDPNHILMGFSDEDQFLSDINLVNVETGRYKRIRRGREDVQYWYTDRRGEPRVGQGRKNRRFDDANVWQMIIRDENDDKWRDSSDYPGLEADTRIFGFTSDPMEMVIGYRGEKETLGVYVYDLEQKQIVRELFHHDTYDAQGIVITGDGDVVGAQYVGDEPETELFGSYDSVLERIRSRFPGYTVDYIDHSDTARRFLVKLSHASDPGALVLANDSLEELTVMAKYYPDLAPQELGRVYSVAYEARDKQSIPAYLTLPPGVADLQSARGLPFVVLPHGGPYARKSKRFDYFAQFFATRGFAVLQMNFRGSVGYGQTFEDSGRENWALMLEDIEDGSRWLRDSGLADPERLCIVGWSYGGYAALMGAIESPEHYACAASMAGVTDLNDLINDMKKYRFGAQAANSMILDGIDDRKDLKLFSPVKRASELEIPLFLAHGTSDVRVHFDQFRRMQRALRKSPAEVTYMEFEDEDHFLSSEANRKRFFVGLDRFLLESVGRSEFAR